MVLLTNMNREAPDKSVASKVLLQEIHSTDATLPFYVDLLAGQKTGKNQILLLTLEDISGTKLLTDLCCETS